MVGHCPGAARPHPPVPWRRADGIGGALRVLASPFGFWSVGAGWLGLAILRVLQFRSAPVCWRAAGLEFGLATSMLLGLFTN